MKYSIVIAIYNDGYLAHAMCEEVVRVFNGIEGEKELIFVNDGSKDDSQLALNSLVNNFEFVKVIELSRNFGQHNALACGFKEAKGDIIIRMNVDQQDPPSELPKLISLLRDSQLDLVVGRYSRRVGSVVNKLTSRTYFYLFGLLTGFTVLPNSSAMRVMSRNFIDAYNTLTEKSRFPQGLDAVIGFNQGFVEIQHHQRLDNKSSYTLLSRIRLGLEGILYFSDRPIKILAFFGFIISLIGIIFGCMIAVAKIIGFNLIPGYASLSILILTTFGLQLMSIGLVGLYIGRIFREVQNRPLYFIKKVHEKNSHV